MQVEIHFILMILQHVLPDVEVLLHDGACTLGKGNHRVRYSFEVDINWTE